MGIKGARDLMHLKSYAIDGRLLRPGSANWSPTGLKRQDNDVRYETTPEAVELFERKFAEMWNRAGNVEAEARTLRSREVTQVQLLAAWIPSLLSTTSLACVAGCFLRRLLHGREIVAMNELLN